MRLKLKIDHLPNRKIPINYQYLISSWIYQTLYKEDSAFADWLHEHGYQLNGKKYKHFCFSMLNPKLFKIHPKDKVFELVEGPTDLILSFNIDKAGKDIIKGLFKANMMQLQSGERFNILGMINNIELIKPPHFTNEMKLRAKTPICISVGNEENSHVTYLHPEDDRFSIAFGNHLVNKANAYLGEEKYTEEQVEFQLISKKVKSKLWTIKGIEIKGYLFDFKINAPKELIEIGYYAGFGVQNAALGMGFCEVVE